MPKPKAKGLGRGFADLIPTELDAEFDLTIEEDRSSSELRDLKLADVEPDPDQPRREFDQTALEALANSIKEHGVLQPIVVTKIKDKYIFNSSLRNSFKPVKGIFKATLSLET